MGAIETIRELSGPLLADAGLELWDVEQTRGIVRILVDRDGGVDLDALTRASRLMSDFFDKHAELAPSEAYQLEVSSPGIERTLRTPEQYARYVGALVSARTRVAVAGQRRWRGTLEAVDDDGVVIVTEDPPPAGEDAVSEGRLRLSYDEIDRVRTVLVWGPAAAPQKGRGKAQAGGAARRADPRDKVGAGRAGRSGADVKETS
jgi:ribosome maturation factor RimP